MELFKEPFLWEYLPTANKPVVLYGMGNGADRLRRACEEYGVQLSGVFASDGFVRGHSYAGFPVLTYDQMKDKLGEFIVLVAFGTHRPEVIANICRIANEQELYLPDTEVVSGNSFTRRTLERDLDRIAHVYQLLEDERSKQTMEELLKYRVSGKISHLLPLFPSADEARAETILQPSKNEVVVDGGAYTGDTVASYVKAVGGFDSLTAFEPDKKTFRKLRKALSEMNNVVAVQAALGESDRRISFASYAGRQSRVGTGETVEQRALDTAVEHASYIKLDVEGREIAALQGARHVIATNKPKMCISTYHRHADLFSIPEYVLSLRPDYKIWLRASASLPAWDTCYLFA